MRIQPGGGNLPPFTPRYGRPPFLPDRIRHSAGVWNDFLYVAGRLLVTERGRSEFMRLASDLLPRFDEFRGEAGDVPTRLSGISQVVQLEPPAEGSDDPNGEVRVVEFPPGRPGPDDPVLVALEWAVSVGLGEEIAPDHVLTLAGHTNFYPARPIEPTSRQLDGDGNEIGCALGIGVADVGFDDDFQARQNRNIQAPALNRGVPPAIKPDYGHGEWVAWLASLHNDPSQQVGQQTPVIGESIQEIWDSPDQNFPERHVATSDLHLGSALENLLDRDEVRIITITAGGPVGAGSSLVKTRQALARAEREGVLVVAAIGNDSKRQRIFPAAYDQVLAVGATTTDVSGKVSEAAYNNRFPGIDLYAPGEHVVPFLAAGDYMVWPGKAGDPPGYDPDPLLVTFPHNRASIEGTSFAVPVAAGAVAERCQTYRAFLAAPYHLRPKLAALLALRGNMPPGFRFAIDSG